MEYKQTRDFMRSLRELNAKGGVFKKAADKIMVVLFKISNGDSGDPLKKLATTNHGENRVSHCVKYDLPGAARLITTQHKGLCLLCFAGDHKSCDKWLDNNRGQTPVVDETGKLNTVQISSATGDEHARVSGQSGLAQGALFEMLPGEDFDLLVEGLPRSLQRDIEGLDSVSDEDTIYGLVSTMDDEARGQALFDVFSLLRQNKRSEAGKRLDLFLGRSQTLEELSVKDIAALANSESIQSLSTADPNFRRIFQHFVENADYMDWMLFLHPDQTNVVDLDFNGAAKLLGVSGSGKTCVVVKRAIRLAQRYANENILILTLNRPLAALIERMVQAACLDDVRERIQVKPFCKVCQEILHRFEPENDRLYDDKTWKSGEHIDEIWREYYRCELNNSDARVLHPIHDTLISRSVNAEQYVREEYDWIRSAVSPLNRDQYLDIARKGRSYPLDRGFRELLLEGLKTWEKKMLAVGVTDYLGIATALYKYIDKIEPIYRCVLIDEAQDFGTIEYEIIRKLAKRNENDLFFCGDAAQQVSAKHQSFRDAGIEMHPSRTTKITKNYRNSYEILSAAEGLLIENMSDEMEASEDFEVLDPQYADFSSPQPLVLKADNLEDEIAAGIKFLTDYLSECKNERACLAICGYSLFEIQSFGEKIGLPVLDGSISIDADTIYLSDLEQTKGFEFDAVCILNCNEAVLPDPLQPEKEQFRDLCRFYVAMTRAKMQLVVSYSGRRSNFITSEKIESLFQEEDWFNYVSESDIERYGLPPTLKEIRLQAYLDGEIKPPLEMSGPEILYTREAIGLDGLLVEKLRTLIPGKTTIDTESNVRVRWKSLKDASEDFDLYPRARELFGMEGLELLKPFLESVRARQDAQELNLTIVPEKENIAGVVDICAEEIESDHSADKETDQLEPRAALKSG